MPSINHALRHFYREHPESVEISLESVGVSPSRTQPTVLVVCTSVSKVRAILKRKLGELFNGTTGFALKVCRGQVLRSRKGVRSVKRSMAHEGDQEDAGDHSHEIVPANPNFQERPNNGASIGAWIGDRHLPPVTFGGLVVIDDKPYGMTVHHMLDDPDRDQGAENQLESKPTMRSSARPDDSQLHAWYAESSGASSDGEDFACEFSDSDSDDYSETDVTSDAGMDSDEYESDEAGEYDEPGDIPGIEAGCGDGYIITQPALDDVEEGFYPSPETADEDHLDSYTLGEMYASSGIRRRRENGLVHEIDWALFEFQNNRQPNDNFIPKANIPITVAQGKSDLSPGISSLHPTTVAPTTSLPGLEVQCIARTSGLQTGIILPALTSVKIYGRASPSHTYQVSSTPPPTSATNETGGRLPLGIPGDSGAWVVDRRHGRVCGHVLAWSERKQVAYICPMDVLLLDIAETLEATEVRLPGGEAVIKILDREEGEVSGEHVETRRASVGRDSLSGGRRRYDDGDDDGEQNDNVAPLLVDSQGAAQSNPSKGGSGPQIGRSGSGSLSPASSPERMSLPGRMKAMGLGETVDVKS
jgi:hypothetical protein